MSNGIGKNSLNDISKVYLTQVAEKKDDSYLEPDMKKRQKNNEKARKELAKGPQMKNPHFESLDPVGKEDGDIDNDGDKDSSDKYLAKRRKAIGKAISKTSKKKMDESISNWRQDLSEIMTDDIDSKPIKEKKVKNKITINPKLSEAIAELGGTVVEMIEEVEVEESASDTESQKSQQIQKKQIELDRRKLRLRMKAAQKKQSTAADTVVEKNECAHNMKGKECPVHGKNDCSSLEEVVTEEDADSLKDRRMERGGVDGNNRYDKAPGKPNIFGKKMGQKYNGMSALEKVKASIRAKHGHGAIKEDAKMAKQSDEKLAALHKQVSSSDQSLPSNQFMMKRVTKEMNRRKKAT